jgi:chromosome segregation ATPase
LTKLAELKNKYEEQNKNLQSLLQKTSSEVSQFKDQNKVYATENAELRNAVKDINETRKSIQRENEALKALVETAQYQVMDLDKTKGELEMQNKELQQIVKDNEEQVDELEEQVTKLYKLHENSKQLIMNLVSAGDIFQQFQDSIGEDVEQLDQGVNSLNTVIERLNGELTKKEFNDLDKDGDGVVTKDEYDKYFA